MIYSLKGKITKIDENTIVVDSGDVAFEVTCSSFTADALSKVSEPQTVLTYLQVREDALCLFGFKDTTEKFIFSKLILVSGVGPKMAITILSGMSIDNLLKAIASSDTKSLASIKGLGKKTAERIVLELCNAFGGVSDIAQMTATSQNTKTQDTLRPQIDEAVEVLVSSGLQKNQAISLAKDHFVEGMTSEELVVVCFKNLK